MEVTGRSYRAEWITDHRRHRRWLGQHTVLIRCGGREYLGKTEDISVGGVQIRLSGAELAPGAAVGCSLVSGRVVHDLTGTVVYTVPDPGWMILGLAFDDLPPPTTHFLAETYPPGSEVLPSPE